MNDDLVERLRYQADEARRNYPEVFRVSEEIAYEAADCIEGLQGQIRVIQSAAKYALKSYKEHLAVYRQKLDEKPPVWHDDVQSLQERDAIMTNRIEKLETALRVALPVLKATAPDDLAVIVVRQALEGKND